MMGGVKAALVIACISRIFDKVPINIIRNILSGRDRDES